MKSNLVSYKSDKLVRNFIGFKSLVGFFPKKKRVWLVGLNGRRKGEHLQMR